MNVFKLCAAACLALAVSLANANHDQAGKNLRYRLTITNLTPAQTFTPVLVATHNHRIALLEVGAAASEELAILAEAGMTGPLTEVLEDFPQGVAQVKTIAGLLPPGQSASVIIRASKRTPKLSLAAMLIPTNDTFVALDGVTLPNKGTQVYYALAYDAGSEANDQACANIPGPRCEGQGVSEPSDSDEGFVHVSNGFHDLGDMDMDGGEVLKPAHYDWNNPVARITVKRLQNPHD
ncbi:MAG: hypothetical protein GYB33_16920 [Gammaproteobacteria bacterium]|nr:hypothetical protein [Gammaproteobacteria bacterium]